MKVRLELCFQGNVVKVEVVSVENRGAGGVDTAGDDDAHAVQAVLGQAFEGQQLVALRRDALSYLRTVQMGEGDGDTRDDFQRIVHQADFDIGTADVHTDLVHTITPCLVNSIGVFSIILQKATPVKENVPVPLAFSRFCGRIAPWRLFYLSFQVLFLAPGVARKGWLMIP